MVEESSKRGASSTWFRISLPWFTFLSALLLLAVYNLPLWRRLLEIEPSWDIAAVAFHASLILVLLLLLISLLSALLFRWTAKPLMYFLLIVSAVVTAFMLQFGIVIDKSMVQNVVETDWREAWGLLNLRLVSTATAFAIVPALLLMRMEVRFRGWRSEVRTKALMIAVSLLISGLLIAIFSAQYISLSRNHRELRFMVTPTNVISASMSYAREAANRVGPLQPVGLDARVAHRRDSTGKPRLLVIVLGETARAADFVSANTPKLRSEPVLHFNDVAACGTSTAVSLPCMFSDLGEQRYDGAKARERENLLDVLRHAGVNVIWRDNNSGCKNVCDRVEIENLASKATPTLCTPIECYDEILLQGLEQRIATVTADTVIVLHQKGSHGPDYFNRYPTRFERYTPACKSADLSRCDATSIRNAYDNTILYTDYIVWQVLKTVEHATHVNGALLYISDHGESLGELGLYLHGMPRLIAPAVQTQVPMALWFSPGYTRNEQLSTSCANARIGGHYSHDNFFHTVLGLMDVQTADYRSSLDIFAGCKAATLPVPAVPYGTDPVRAGT